MGAGRGRDIATRRRGGFKGTRPRRPPGRRAGYLVSGARNVTAQSAALGQLPFRPDKMAGISIGIMLQIILVFRLGFPEGAGGSDLGDHLAGPQAGCVDVGDGVLGDLLLRIVAIEDGRAVTGADVVALAVPGGGVVDLEEKLQDLPIADPAGIERDLD